MTQITWTCEICGRRRDDAKIKVSSYTCGLVTRNVRYCVDSIECGDAARQRAVEDAERLGGSTLTEAERERLVAMGFGSTLTDIDGLEIA